MQIPKCLKKSQVWTSHFGQRGVDWDTVESMCGAGGGLNCGLLLNVRLKEKSFILGNAQSSDITHHNLNVFKAKVNGWFGNDKIG